jgi:hypothetical protein
MSPHDWATNVNERTRAWRNFLGEITINPEKNYQTMAKPKES